MINVVKEVFNKSKKTKIALGAVLVALCLPFNSLYAASNGCDKDDYDRINPALALCSTHVYNIGKTQNQSSEANRQVMRDVIALKTTVITQQLEQQYDFLEATVKRLKTQLEKAVLTTSFEAAGASSSSSSRTSNDSNVVLIGAENCLLKTSTSDGLNCIQNNIRIVLQAVSSGNIGEAYRQLQKDLSFARSYAVSGVTFDNATNQYSEPVQCNGLKAQKDSVNNCAYALNIAVMQQIEKNNNSKNMYNNSYIQR